MAMAKATNATEDKIGHPVQIIEITMNKNKPSKMSLNNTNLRFILNGIGDRNVAMISIAGPSRLGKSFLLSFMIRYLESLEKGDSTNWIDRDNYTKALVGFPFQNGIERMTTGLWLWSRPFIIKNSVSKEIAVLLMDTQGVFDDHTTMKEWSAIVGISLLTSSCLIYNVVNNLQEDALAILETFMQFGILAMENSESTESCFQKLIFLIRDWNMPDDCEYGPLGGEKFLKLKLQMQSHLPPESVRVRQTLKRCFEEIDCFLMPDPGEEAKSKDFKGSLVELDEKFVKSLITFMDALLSPEQIAVKKVDGQPIEANELLKYFQRYILLFNSSGIPSPSNMLDATAYASCDASVSKSLSYVNRKFLDILEKKGFVKKSEWEELFNPLQIEAMKKYDAKRKFGDPKIAAQQRRRLEAELIKLLTDIKEKNDQLMKQKSDTEQNKQIEEFSFSIRKNLGKNFFTTEQLESTIYEETESVLKNFCKIFGHNKEFLEEVVPDFTQKIKETADIFRKDNDEKILKATHVLNSAVEAAFKKYQEDMDLRISQTGDGTISDDFLLKLDATFRNQVFSFFGALPKEGSETFVAKFRSELEDKMNEKLSHYAAANANKRVKQENRAEELIVEITELYLKEIFEMLSREASPDRLFLENKHFKLQEKYFDVFISKCGIHDVSTLLPFKQKLGASLQEALESAKNQLFENQNKVRKNISIEIENLVEGHHNKLSELIHDSQICTEEKFRNTHEKVLQFCQLKLNFPSFLTDQERREYSDILLSHLKQDFELLLTSYENKRQEANRIAEKIISDIMDQYHQTMIGKTSEIFEKSQLDECHLREKKAFGQKLNREIQIFPSEILNQYQDRLELQLDQAYVSIEDNFEAKLAEVNTKIITIYQKSISQYGSQMDMKGQANVDRDLLNEWHGIYKQKAVSAFEEGVRTLKVNCLSQRNKLERQLSEEFQNILVVKDLSEQELNAEGEKIVQDSLEKFNQDALHLLLNKKIKEDAFFKELNQIKILATQSFQEKSSDIPRELMNRKRDYLDKEIIKSYTNIYDNFKLLKEEESLLFETSVATAVSHYQSTMDSILNQESGIVEMDQLELIHKSNLQNAIEKIPADCLESMSQLVRQKIDSIFQSFKVIQLKRLDDSAKNSQKVIQEIKEEITDVISQKSKEAQYPEELRDLKDKLREDAQIMLKSIIVSGGESKMLLLEDEIDKHLQETLSKGEEEINSREPDSNMLSIVKNSALKIYEEEMEKHFSITPFTKPRLLKDRHKIACKKAMHKPGTMIPLSPKEAIGLDCMFQSAFEKFQNRNRMNTPKNPAIGIDLGTTFSCVAVYNQGLKAVKIIPNENTKNTTPSYVAFTDDNTEFIGDPAKNQAHANPENTIFDAKRLIGRRFAEDVVQRDIKLWPFKVIDDNGVPKIKVNDKTYFPEEISAKILKKMKDIAEIHLNCKVDNAVITVPAYFNDGQKQATIHAGQVAGLNVLGILSEPTAAAIAYSLNETYNKSRNVLIFDFGGGTFDVAVLAIFNGKINVKAVDGDTHLGGEDFDSNMVDYCVEQFKIQENIDLVADRDSENISLRGTCNRRIRRLRNECEKRKIDLSGTTTTTVAIECIHETTDLHVEIVRDTFEKINQNLFDKAICIVERALESAHLTKAEIDDIVLVGGSTRVPKIQELLINLFDGRALNRSINPDEAVAFGAAIHAAILNGCTAEELSGFELTDVTPLSIGIEIIGGHHSIIIDKNTPIPVKQDEKYTTSKDNQTSVNIQIYEGEEERAKDNHLLGEFVLDGIPKGKKGSADITVSMEIDINGILTVNATCTGSGTSKNLSIQQNKGRLTEAEIKELALKT